MQEPPVAHSTPKIVPIVKRPGIRDMAISADEKSSSDQDSSEHEPEELRESYENSKKNELIQRIWYRSEQYTSVLKLVLLLFIVTLAFFYGRPNHNSPKNQEEIKDLQTKFGSQEEDFWISFQELVKDSVKYNHPKSLILLYNNDTVDMIEQLLDEMSKYAVCKITACSFNPIIEESSNLEKIGKDDHGNIIAEFKDDIDLNGVMIVKNMQHLSGKSAMVFQTLCDEFQSKALFLFTLKIEQQFEDKTKYVELVLRKKWSELNDDIFYPLLTRISSLIFVVKDNKN